MSVQRAPLGEPRGRDLGDGCREAWGQGGLFAPDGAPLSPITKLPSIVAPQRLTEPEKCRTRATPYAAVAHLTADPEPANRRREGRDVRAGLLAALRPMTTQARVAKCGLYAVPTAAPGLVTRRHALTGELVAGFAGLQRCASVWCCPECAYAVRAGRATELEEVAARWLDAQGDGTVLLFGLTIPHPKGYRLPGWGRPLADDLATLLALFRRALAQLLGGRWWHTQRRRWGIAHMARAWDVTHGPNGWHPHVHGLFFLAAPLAADALAALTRELFQRWAAILAGLGLPCPDPRVGVHIEAARDVRDVARYAAQVVGAGGWGVGQEVARMDLKASAHQGHRSAWQILADAAADGDADDWRRYRRYELALKGLRALLLSRGLRAAVGLGAPATDAELAEREGNDVRTYDPPVHVYAFRGDEWAVVRGRPRRIAALMDAAEQGGPYAGPHIAALVADWLARDAWSAAETERELYGSDPPTVGV